MCGTSGECVLVFALLGMAGVLDVNFDSDEDFEETAGRGGGVPAGRGNVGRVRGGGGEGVRGVRGGRGGGDGVGRGAVIEGLSQVAGASRAVEGRGAGQVGRGGGGVGGREGAGGSDDPVAVPQGGQGHPGRGRGGPADRQEEAGHEPAQVRPH